MDENDRYTDPPKWIPTPLEALAMLVALIGAVVLTINAIIMMATNIPTVF